MENTLIPKRVEEGSLIPPMPPEGKPGVAGRRGTDCGPGILGPTGPVAGDCGGAYGKPFPNEEARRRLLGPPGLVPARVQEGSVIPLPDHSLEGPTGPTGPMCNIGTTTDFGRGAFANRPTGPTGTPGPIGPTGTPGPTGAIGPA